MQQPHSSKTIDEWREYYFKNVRSKDHLEELGKKLYIKITEVISSEVEEITEQDCINYMTQLVIDRTFDGYMTEIKTVYGQLEQEIGIKIEPAPDEWDRLYNVDFFIKIKEKHVGIQIKPINQGIQLSQIFKEKNLQLKTHENFEKEYGGKVFYIFSSKVGEKKEIRNKEVLDEIRKEIERLNK
ncbi:MAG: MjaI family restriction endonuclease [bacterium]